MENFYKKLAKMYYCKYHALREHIQWNSIEVNEEDISNEEKSLMVEWDEMLGMIKEGGKSYGVENG